MPNAYVCLQGGREGGQKSTKPAYVIHGCSLKERFNDCKDTIRESLFLLLKLSFCLKNVDFDEAAKIFFNTKQTHWGKNRDKHYFYS